MDLFDNFEIIDILAHEYGWSIEYVQKLDINEIQDLLNAINIRKTDNYKMISYISVLAFSGKTIDSILKPQVESKKVVNKEDIEKTNQLREKQQEQIMVKLFTSLGMKPKKLKESLDKGKLEI